jgi:hypothetical protein
MEKQTNLRALDFLYEYGGKTQSEVSAIWMNPDLF